jgi:Toprim domain
MTVDEMENVLDRLGIEIISITGDEIKAHCPAHLERKGKADSNPSWSINADTGAHNCFSCHFRGNVHTLVAYVNGVPLDDATNWLNVGERNLSRAFERLINPPKPVQEYVQPITESMLSAFVAPPEDALRARGISANGAAYYGILWNPIHSSWILPLRDPKTEQLVGWQEKWANERRFNNYPPKVSKSHCLFGYERHEDEMIVVESPLDVARLASLGIFGGVAVCGSAVSTAQVNLIRSAKRIIIAMDNDTAGISSSMELLQISKDMGFECWFFNYDNTDMKDIGGMSKAEILFGLDNARHSIHGKKAIL